MKEYHTGVSQLFCSREKSNESITVKKKEKENKLSNLYSVQLLKLQPYTGWWTYSCLQISFTIKSSCLQKKYRIQEWDDNIYTICKALTRGNNKLNSMSHVRRKELNVTKKTHCQQRLFWEQCFLS